MLNNNDDIAEHDEEDLFEHHRFQVDPGQQILRIDKYLIDRLPKTCQNLVNEFYGYEWETDRFGRQQDRPVDFNNHLIDAARYGAMMRLSQVATAKGKYVIRVR